MANYSNISAHWCPEGFVIPDHPFDSRNDWVTNSSCAIGCISPIFSTANWNSQQGDVVVCSWIGIFSMVLLLATHLRQGKLTYLILCTVFFCFILSISFIALSYYPIQDRFCYDNSIGSDMVDGLTLCAYEGMVCTYVGMGVVYAW